MGRLQNSHVLLRLPWIPLHLPHCQWTSHIVHYLQSAMNSHGYLIFLILGSNHDQSHSLNVGTGHTQSIPPLSNA